MKYKKSLFVFIVILITTDANYSPISYDKSGQLAVREPVRRVRTSDPIIMSYEILKNTDFSKLFKELHQYLSPEGVRIVSTLGLLSGALRVEESMREHLSVIVDDLLDKFNITTPMQNMGKLIKIEHTINRDKSVVKMLNEMIKYTRNETTLDNLQSKMLNVLKESDATTKQLYKKKAAIDKEFAYASVGKQSVSTGKLMDNSEWKYHIKQHLYDVREMIDNHIEQIHTSVTDNVKQTIKYIQNVEKTNKNLLKRPNGGRQMVKLHPSMFAMRRLWDQVASDNEPTESSLNQMIYGRQIEFQSRITKGEEVALRTTRLTMGERIAPNARLPTGVFLVDSRIDRFKRQNGKTRPNISIDIDFGDDDNDNNDPKKKKRKDEDDDDKDNEIDGEDDDDRNGGDDDGGGKSGDNDGGKSGNDDKDGDKGDSEQMSGSESDSSSGEGPGGLAGFIFNLSGGEEGSDVNALIGVLSQVVANLFGAGGIDVQAIVGSGTALLASLIGGDDNFGRVLGNIVGQAIEGFSGGGGAELNGQFFGQFMGRFISVLSADPENEDGPLLPEVFIENFYDGIARGSAAIANCDQEKKDGCDDENKRSYGSDSSSFIKSLIAGIINAITKASTSSSAGSSKSSAQGSAGASGSLSTGSSTGSSGFSGNSSFSDDQNNNNNNNNNNNDQKRSERFKKRRTYY